MAFETHVAKEATQRKRSCLVLGAKAKEAKLSDYRLLVRRLKAYYLSYFMISTHLISVFRQCQGAERASLSLSELETKTTPNSTSIVFQSLEFVRTSRRKLALCEVRHWQGKCNIMESYNLVAKCRTAFQYFVSISRVRSFLMGSSSRLP
jgi:hypothetical protein